MEKFLNWSQEIWGWYKEQPVRNWHVLLFLILFSINIIIYLIKKIANVEREIVLLVIAFSSILFAFFVLVYGG